MFTNLDLTQASNESFDSLNQQYEFVEAEDWKAKYNRLYEIGLKLFQENELWQNLAVSLMAMSAEEFVKWQEGVKSGMVLGKMQ
jgi:hypothetical protein